MKLLDERPASSLDRWATAVAVTAAVLLHSAVGAWLIATPNSAGVARESTSSPIIVTFIAAAPKEPSAIAQSFHAAQADRGGPMLEPPRTLPAPPAIAAAKSSKPVQMEPAMQSAHQPTRRDDRSSTSANRAIPETADARYRSAADLDPPPRPLEDIQPEYPASAGLQQGTVVIRLLINSSGEVDDVTVVDASPKGLFEASAIAAFGAAKFAPGRYRGVPVASQMTIAVDYTPTNRGGAVSGQSGLGFLK